MTTPKKSDVRLNKTALFAGLGYTPHAGQLEVHRSKAKRRVLACGTRWGKSTLAAYECVSFLLEPRDKALGWLIAPTYELSRRVFERAVEIMHTHLKHRVKSYDRRANSIVVSNFGGGTSELRARSADRPAGLLGDALDFLVVDEAVKIREDTWDGYISPRLIDRHGSALILSTPSTTQSWFFREYRRAKKDPEYAAFCMPTISNPHVPSNLVEAERGRLDADTFGSQYEAKFVGIDIEPCDRCGGPKAGASCLVSLWGDEQPKTCPDCGKLVGDDGLTRVALYGGRPQATIIRWLTGREPDIPIPGGVNKVMRMEDTPENIEPIDLEKLADHVVILHRPLEHPEELPPGCE